MRLSILGLTPTLLFLAGCWPEAANGIPTSNGRGTIPKEPVDNRPQRQVEVAPVEPMEADASDEISSDEPESEKYNFPYFIPGSRIVIGEELVDEVNALATKDEQRRFLIAILPSPDQQVKRLSDRQLYAIHLLSLTNSEAAIDPLLNCLDFGHKSVGSPSVHALARLGEIAVEPVLKALHAIESPDRQKVNAYAAVLILIKKNTVTATALGSAVSTNSASKLIGYLKAPSTT